MDMRERHTYSVPSIDADAAKAIEVHCGLRPLTSRILVARGITTPEQAEAFLTPSLERDWLDPTLIPGLEEVAAKVEEVIRRGGRILVFGDFDVDGITATAVSVRGLRALGADVSGLIPHRYNEGYALSQAAVMRGMEREPELIMTVDCGISCADEVAWMLSQGIDVCITDHHEPADSVPRGVPVADPKLDHNCPCCDLAGVGVALKLITLLGQRFGQPELWRQLTDLAALGTIADLMTLSRENRALVADGIRRINLNPRVSISELAAICATRPQDISSSKLSFSLIPRLNASGRMGDASVALELLLSDDVAVAQRLAAELDAVNQQRREAEAELARQVEAHLEEHYQGEAFIIVSGEGWHEGVKGIVASRIARAYQRPTAIFTVEDGVARGSGRTYGGINLFELVSSCSDLFTKFGGHAAAVGLTLPADKLDELGRRLCAASQELLDAGVSAPLEADAAVTLDECDIEGFQELERLQPFGNSNPVPALVARNVFLSNRGAVGKAGNHLRYQATDGAERVAGIWFGVEDMEAMLGCEAACDILFEPAVDEWQGRYTAKLMTKDMIVHCTAPAPSEQEDPFEELFARSVEICDKGDYAGITQVPSFNTKVVGVTFENRQDALESLEAGVELALVRQPGNEFDPNAIAVQLLDGTQLGYLNRALAARLAPVMDAGEAYSAAVSAVTGGPGEQGAQQELRVPGPLGVRDPGVVDRSRGVNIVVRRDSLYLASDQESPQAQRLQLEQAKERWRQVPAAQLDDELRRALIGERPLHAAQAQTLEHLAAGRSTLAIMATGRGKSLIFHLHAARTALRQGRASIFVYPLRALVADQAFHLAQTYSRFGLQVQVLTGETEEPQRREIYAGLEAGEVDVVLTTPEFLAIHAGRLAQTGRVGFVVVDEAHHIGQSRAGNRPAYLQLKDALATLGQPLVLAVTATAADQEASLICSTLSIRELVLDPSVRSNLRLDDKRDLRDRESYLASIVAGGGKLVAYVNSREQSIQLTRMLRHRLPQMAPGIGFYNAGLPKHDRKRIEEAFRTGALQAIVSTSAFGEGIDIPDVEHVVLYHMPFSSIEFNQMAGRCGRDGREACVHLLYGYGDARINERILSSGAPDREAMVALYKALRARAAQAAQQGEESFSCTNAQLAQEAAQQGRAQLDESGVSCGLGVFRELGFLETSGSSVARRITMVEGPQKMSLTDSVRYREGLQETEGFALFKRWALGASPDELLARFNRPILPQDPQGLGL
ncbi:MAG: single-stranded-DNA-specific exonuclease RecJ [Coriobacteriales bacterium]